MSAMIRTNRSSSRLSISSKHGGGSRASDDDSKTAVKVAVRVRPPLTPQDPGFDLIPQRFRTPVCHVTSPSSLAVDASGGRKVFVFDRVFDEDVDQEGVFDYVTDSVNSFMQGYNVSILAYGQSGAGKSYTMGTTGPADQANAQVMGIIPRAAALLYDKLEGSSGIRAPGSGIRVPSASRMSGIFTPKQSPANKSWQLKATYVEIYNESLRDLLLPDTVSAAERPTVTIREDRDGRILLTGLTQVTINSVDDLLNALNFGSSIRQTDATAVNAKSSRSHAVFSLNLVQKKTSLAPLTTREKHRSVPVEAMSSSSENWITVDSKLHFVDLAGSERLKNTQASGERAKEGISINAGLASLGKVISQLSSRSHGSHVSYRDSKLTRLLQDSLGGNAITYMIACINPAEFHLSESLNTVQYAQRARAIQVKPQIQQVHDDSDKQAAIERLKAEVQFLRDQIRLSERSDRKNANPQERAERQHEREVELQNQLLDFQENYSALSARHAKLISEITKARDNQNAETPLLKDAIGDSALDRMKRSNSFAEAVESVVLEYEKTIQSLESSLSNTRTSLSTNESDLLEKETRIAFLESQNHQLQSRIQKAVDREATNEDYVKSLERQIDSSTSGIEKNDTTITDLRDKLQQARENESSCEEYISTLEERLAENEQEVEMMTREIDRLKHVVERQRSIGKLDNLLHELDATRPTDAREVPLTNGHAHTEGDAFAETQPHPNTRTSNDGSHQFNTVDMITEEEDGERPSSSGTVHRNRDAMNGSPHISEEPPSPAQSKFVHDKLDTVTQELFDLRVEHEGTVQDYEKLASKYQEALRTLAALQDTVDEARHGRSLASRPTSFLGPIQGNGTGAEAGQPSSSRTLSAELSSAESGNSLNPDDDTSALDLSEHDAGQPSADFTEHGEQPPRAVLVQELQALKVLHAEKEQRVAELKQDYEDLQEQHQDALDYVEELKSEVTKAQMNRPNSPSLHMIRRKSSQAVLASDRSNRALTSLRNFALDRLEEDPDSAQTFELSLNTVMGELQSRSERVQELESEIASVRKEMESKMTLISGLTKERSSLSVSKPLDMTIVATMQEQIKLSEDHLREVKDTYAQRELELQEQVATLKASANSPRLLDDSLSPRSVPAVFTFNNTDAPGAEGDEARHSQLVQLSNEAALWQAKHLEAISATQASEKQHRETVRDLEHAMKQLEEDHTARLTAIEESRGAEATAALEQERSKHNELVTALQAQVDEHRATAVSNAARLAELEESHSSIIKQIEEDAEARALTERELDTHRSLVDNLERQIEEHKGAIDYHQQGMDSLQQSHAEELEKLTLELTAQQESTSVLQTDLTKTKGDLESLLQGISTVLNEETDMTKVHGQIEALVEERKSINTRMDQAVTDLNAARSELSEATKTIDTLKNNLKEFELINAETLKELEMISEKEQKSSRLVEELEEQLNQNWDQHEAANNRLSALQTERSREFQDVVSARGSLEKEIEDSRIKIALLEVCSILSRVVLVLTNAVSTLGCQAPLQPSVLRSSRGPPKDKLEQLECPQELDTLIAALSSACHSPSSSAPRQPTSQPAECSLSPGLTPPEQGHCSRPDRRRPGGSHPHDREAPVCREAADSYSRGRSDGSRGLEPEEQVGSGPVPEEVRRSRGRTQLDAQGAQHGAPLAPSRRRRAQRASARRSRARTPRGAHGRAQRRKQEEQEEGYAELLLSACPVLSCPVLLWVAIFTPQSSSPSALQGALGYTRALHTLDYTHMFRILLPSPVG
jgi:chromosome segregation ATPase